MHDSRRRRASPPSSAVCTQLTVRVLEDPVPLELCLQHPGPFPQPRHHLTDFLLYPQIPAIRLFMQRQEALTHPIHQTGDIVLHAFNSLGLFGEPGPEVALFGVRLPLHVVDADFQG